MGCAAAGLLSELDRHRAVACRLVDLPADQTEAVRHVGVMTPASQRGRDGSSVSRLEPRVREGRPERARGLRGALGALLVPTALGIYEPRGTRPYGTRERTDAAPAT